MTELILNSNEHKIDSNKLRYEFKSPIKFNNSFYIINASNIL